MLNWQMMKNPANWIILTAMWMIATLAIAAIVRSTSNAEPLED